MKENGLHQKGQNKSDIETSPNISETTPNLAENGVELPFEREDEAIRLTSSLRQPRMKIYIRGSRASTISIAALPKSQLRRPFSPRPASKLYEISTKQRFLPFLGRDVLIYCSASPAIDVTVGECHHGVIPAPK